MRASGCVDVSAIGVLRLLRSFVLAALLSRFRRDEFLHAADPLVLGLLELATERLRFRIPFRGAGDNWDGPP